MPQQSTDPVTIVVSLVILFFVLRYLLASPADDAAQRHQTGSGVQAGSSGNGRRPPRRRVAVSAAQVDSVLQMFPTYPREAIEQDLARNGGNVEQTLDNILSGAIPAPLPPIEPTSSNSSATPSAFTPSPYLTPKILDGESTAEPPKVWEQTSSGREANLRARKEHMVRLARERMEKAKAEAEAAATGDSSSAS
ncbi:UNVERIFIED_CONTAM: hypothetical protein HDU68_006065 [Siphonaria sp. JEL0065]|nr:hypothetical protein HDU68_006065 [Siphonaria sp. JEL0065]